MSNIVIFSLEGKESNTEVNFYEGLAHHLSSSKLKIFAMGKLSNSSNKEKLMKVKLQNSLSTNNILELKEVNIYFIGDNDNKDDIISMGRALTFISEYISKAKLFNSPKIHDKLILENPNFDALIQKIIGTDTHNKNWKKSTNVNLFNEIYGKTNWSTDPKYLLSDIINFFDSVNTGHIAIIKKMEEGNIE